MSGRRRCRIEFLFKSQTFGALWSTHPLRFRIQSSTAFIQHLFTICWKRWKIKTVKRPGMAVLKQSKLKWHLSTIKVFSTSSLIEEDRFLKCFFLWPFSFAFGSSFLHHFTVYVGRDSASFLSIFVMLWLCYYFTPHATKSLPFKAGLRLRLPA